jgi:hypothetical protein
VEAARAGEQGRGFAVVASEVRSLAQRSAAAASDIKGLIHNSVTAVDGGVRHVEDAGAAMKEIVASVQRVGDIIGEITAAASEQSAGIGQVNQSVGEIDRMTQQNAALVEESAAAVALYTRRRSTIGRGVLLVMAGMGMAVLVMLLRTVAGFTGTLNAESFLQGSALQGLTFVTTFAVLLVASLGFVFMTKERADEANRRLAALDELTGVANRRSIIAALDRDVGRAIRTHESMAVMMVDIDHFKRINDTCGHLAGDQVLRCVVDVIQHRIRAQDIVGRYGGP